MSYDTKERDLIRSWVACGQLSAKSSSRSPSILLLQLCLASRVARVAWRTDELDVLPRWSLQIGTLYIRTVHKSPESMLLSIQWIFYFCVNFFYQDLMERYSKFNTHEFMFKIMVSAWIGMESLYHQRARLGRNCRPLGESKIGTNIIQPPFTCYNLCTEISASWMDRVRYDKMYLLFYLIPDGVTDYWVELIPLNNNPNFILNCNSYCYLRCKWSIWNNWFKK